MRTKVLKIAIGLAAIAIVFWLGSAVMADIQSGWLATSDTQVAKINDLTPNVFPAISNRDCTQLTYITPANSTASDCFVQSPYGSMALFGSPMMFNNSSIATQINSYNNNYILQPVPNQGITVAISGAPVTGSYLYYYTDITRHLSPNYGATGTSNNLTSYTVNTAPDFGMVDKNNKMMAVNASGTLGYSSNGSWMIVDDPGRGFIRVNLATFEIMPFAPSLSVPGDTSSRSAATAISDDGRYAAIASNNYGYVKVYDLSTCTGTSNNDYSQLLACKYRDYWSVVSNKLSNLSSITGVRFINDDNLKVTTVYNRTAPNSYSVANFRVTAPGKLPNSMDYLALGDSYVSGQGEFVYKDGSDTGQNTCHLSPLSYPYTIGLSLFNSYNSIACSGAVTNDVLNDSDDYTGQVTDHIKRKNRDPGPILQAFSPGYLSQIEFIKKYQPRIVTLSIGGNDIGFADMLKSCIKPSTANISAYMNSLTCYNTYDERMQAVQAIGALFQTLQYTYTQLMLADPGMQLYVTGYPQVAAQGDCGANVHLNSDEIQFSQQMIQYMDWTIERAATSVGARYVDIQQALAGSRLCEAKGSAVAVNGITAGNDSGPIGNESFHPNVLGHQLIARTLLDKTNNLKQPMPTADPSLTRPKPTDQLAVALLNNLPYTGTPVPQVAAFRPKIMSAMTVRGATTQISVDAADGLKPSSSYQVMLRPGTSNVGTVSTDSSGNLTATVAIPASTPVGFYTAHILGLNTANQQVDLYITVYVGSSIDDYDGDGVPNSTNQCGIVPKIGQDVDQDGIDDACDPYVGDPPANNYPYRASLTGNTLSVTKL